MSVCYLKIYKAQEKNFVADEICECKTDNILSTKLELFLTVFISNKHF